MRLPLCSFLGLVALLGLAPLNLRAEDAAAPTYYRVKVDKAALFTGPSADSALVRAVTGADRLQNLGCQGLPAPEAWLAMTPEQRKTAKENVWCKVLVDNGDLGWVRWAYVEEDTAPAPTKPLLNCAPGTIDEVICKNPNLMALHQRLLETFNKAASKAVTMPNAAVVEETLIGEHQGWLQSRSACMKALIDPDLCALNMYQSRISELEAKWGLIAPSRAAVEYTCGIIPVTATFYNSLVPVAVLDYGTNHEAFIATPAASGVKYLGPFSTYFWTQGQGKAQFVMTPAQKAVDCTIKETPAPFGIPLQ